MTSPIFDPLGQIRERIAEKALPTGIAFLPVPDVDRRVFIADIRILWQLPTREAVALSVNEAVEGCVHSGCSNNVATTSILVTLSPVH